MTAARSDSAFEDSSTTLGLSAEQILESISDAFIALDRDWRFTYFNAAAERLNGTRRDKVLGRNHWEVYPEAIGTQVEEKFRAVMQTRRPVRFENFYEPWQRWFEIHAYPIASGGICVDYRDVSDRKQVESHIGEVAAANAKFRATFEQASQFAGMLTVDGRLLEANESSLAVAGVERGDVIGKPFWDCVWWASVPRLQEMVQQACKEARAGRTFRADSDYVAAGGERRYVDLMIAPVTSETGEVVFLAATGTDITHRKFAERRHLFLRRIAEATQPLNDSEEMTAVVAELLAEELGVNRCAYAVIDDESVFVITGNYVRGVQSIVGRWPVAAFGEACVEAMLANEPFVVTDSEADPRISPEDVKAFRATAIRAVVCVPLHKNGKFTAAMAVHQSHARNWTEDEIHLVQTVVGLCWESLERARLSEETDRQRRLYEAVLSNMADLAYVFDRNHRFIYANEVLLRMWGRTREEAIGKNCLELGYEPWHAEMHGREIEQVIATKQPIRGEVPFTGTFGRRIYDYIFVPIFDDSGEVEAIAGTTRDVTDRKLYELELEQSERRFRELADASPAMLWLTDADGQCTFLSQRWYEYTGQTIDEALGLGWTNACHPDDTAQTGREFMAASKDHRPFYIEYRLKDRDGQYRWAMDIGRPRFDPTGEFLGLVGTVIEIDDRKRAEEALKLADRRKDEFLATLAHELRNPLAPISNGLEVLPLVEPGSEAAEELRSMMQRQLRQMIRLIDDLLDVSRITRGKVELRRTQIDLETVIEGAIEAIRPFIESCRHELAVVLPARPVMLQGDVGRLVQVFGNLLHNAAKYTGQNGHIWVTVRTEQNYAVVSVRDNGPGIPSEMLTGIFELFRQVDQTLDRAHGGLGIGLTLAKTLVEMHGGTVEAFSEGPGRGSEFIVRLPFDAASQGHEKGDTGFTLKRHLRPRHLNVLVVDDVVASAKTLALMLNGIGQKTHIEHNGFSALTAIESFRPDVVFLDIAMPGMDGYEVARRVRTGEGHQPVLVALTGYGQDEDRKRAVAAGFDHHLVKPTSVDHLREVLMTVPSSESTT
jgi:PAS domain S-box-containing protein